MPTSRVTGSCCAGRVSSGSDVGPLGNARGLGCHLAQWLVAQDEVVFDASTAATARVRELDRKISEGKPTKQQCDASNARSHPVSGGSCSPTNDNDPAQTDPDQRRLDIFLAFITLALIHDTLKA